MKLFAPIAAALAASALLTATPAQAQEIRANLDTDGNGELNAEEFVMAFYMFDMKRFDKDEDGVMTTAEFTAPDNKWLNNLNKRFNTDADPNTLSDDELVQVYLFIFNNRDKDENGAISAAEAPGHMVKK